MDRREHPSLHPDPGSLQSWMLWGQVVMSTSLSKRSSTLSLSIVPFPLPPPFPFPALPCLTSSTFPHSLSTVWYVFTQVTMSSSILKIKMLVAFMKTNLRQQCQECLNECYQGQMWIFKSVFSAMQLVLFKPMESQEPEIKHSIISCAFDLNWWSS